MTNRPLTRVDCQPEVELPGVVGMARSGRVSRGRRAYRWPWPAYGAWPRTSCPGSRTAYGTRWRPVRTYCWRPRSPTPCARRSARRDASRRWVCTSSHPAHRRLPARVQRPAATRAARQPAGRTAAAAHDGPGVHLVRRRAPPRTRPAAAPQPSRRRTARRRRRRHWPRWNWRGERAAGAGRLTARPGCALRVVRYGLTISPKPLPCSQRRVDRPASLLRTKTT